MELRDESIGLIVFRKGFVKFGCYMVYEIIKIMVIEKVFIRMLLEEIEGIIVKDCRNVVIIIVFRVVILLMEGFIKVFEYVRVGIVFVFCGKVLKFEIEMKYVKVFRIKVEDIVIIVDLMIVIGLMFIKVLDEVKKYGNVKCYVVVGVLVVLEGIIWIKEVYLDVEMFVVVIDREFNDYGYIFLGFGDVGDRVFGELIKV